MPGRLCGQAQRTSRPSRADDDDALRFHGGHVGVEPGLTVTTMRAEGTTVEGQEIAQLGAGKPLALWSGGTMLRVMQERAPPWLRIITSE
jgi:hypothetical protein